MKTDSKIKAASVIASVFILGLIVMAPKTKALKETNRNNSLLSDNLLVLADQDNQEDLLNTSNIKPNPEIVFDGLTRQELIEKINRNLNSTIAGKGEKFVDKALELGMDPYLSVAIVLHETGCTWECSDLVKYCYNVGGQKGSPGCNGGSYMAFSSLDEGIDGFMNNLYYNYYSKGLNTPELMNSRYAASPVWAEKINNYIAKIKAS